MGLQQPEMFFARESHITDLTRLAKIDQLVFRLKNLDDDRSAAVLESAAKTFGWSTAKKADGHGYGIACAYEKGGYVATCAEVEVNSKKQVKVVRITQALNVEQ